MTEQMNVPKLRFDEFDGEWQKLTLKQVSTKNISYGVVQTGDKDLIVPCVRVVDLTSGSLNRDTFIKTSEAINQSYKKTILESGELMVALRGVIGLTRAVPVDLVGCNLTRGIARISPDQKRFSSQFIEQALNTPKSSQRFDQLKNGSALKEISIGELNKYSTDYPYLPEQQKIASFLSKVDEKITLLTEKKGKLAEYKKGVMQQLFNGKWEKQDGQLTFIPPTLRFKADDGSDFPDWEEKALIELAAQRFSNGVFNDPKRIGKGYRLINVKDMYSGNFIDTSTLSLLDLSEKEFSNNQVKYGDIFFTRSSLVPSGIAYSNVNLSNDNDITYDGHLIKFSPKLDMISPYYFANYLRSHSSRKSLISRGKQSTMTTIGQEDIKDIRFLIPSLEEQIKIANFLSAIDQKIDLANSELEKAKEWKKGLLQQMFV